MGSGPGVCGPVHSAGSWSAPGGLDLGDSSAPISSETVIVGSGPGVCGPVHSAGSRSAPGGLDLGDSSAPTPAEAVSAWLSLSPAPLWSYLQ